MPPLPPASHVLLVPGLLCTPRVFAAVAPALAGAGHAAAYVDHSAAPDVAAVARAALARAPPRFALAGFSYGGYVALEMARQAPERLTHLALLSSQARADSPQHTARRRALIASARAEGGLVGVLREHLPKLLHPAHLPPGWEARLEAAASAASGGGPAGSPQHDGSAAAAAGGSTPFDAALAMALQTGVDAFETQQRAIMSRRDARDVARGLASAGVPVLTLFGREDEIIPARSHMQLFDELLVAAAAGAPRPQPARSRRTYDRGAGAGGGGGASPPPPPQSQALLPLSALVHHHAHVLLHELAPGVGHLTPLEAPSAVADALLQLLRWPSPHVE
jgi:pimeloyl-ACP methyl ester carboxylesterase